MKTATYINARGIERRYSLDAIPKYDGMAREAFEVTMERHRAVRTAYILGTMDYEAATAALAENRAEYNRRLEEIASECFGD